jgi:magnesium-transporting ATPase (P-type)
MNYIIIGILVLQAILCLIMAIMAGYFLNDTNKNYGSSHGSYHFYLYYQMDLPSPEIIGLIAYFSFFILFNTLVPISLIISLETLKFLQTTWMEFDNAMWDKD